MHFNWIYFAHLHLYISERDRTVKGSDSIIPKRTGNLEFAKGEFTFWLDSDVRAATELLYHIASLALVLYLAPSASGDSFSNQPHKSAHIFMVNDWIQDMLRKAKKEKNCSRSGLRFGATRKSQWSALRLDLWVGEAWRKVICTKLLCVLGFSMALALSVGPWTFLALFTARNALHFRSAVTHRHSAAVLCSLCRSRTLWQRLTTNDLLISDSAPAAYIKEKQTAPSKIDFHCALYQKNGKEETRLLLISQTFQYLSAKSSS